MSYIITRTKFEGGKPFVGQEKIIEICTSREIANAAAKSLTRGICKTYEDRVAVRQGTAESMTNSRCYNAVIRLHGWIHNEILALRRRFPDDSFDCIMERSFYPERYPNYSLHRTPISPKDGFTSKVICLDSPEKSYQIGIGKLVNFRIHHLENSVLHRERVEARILSKLPIEDLLEQAAKIQQAISSRQY